VICYHVKYLIWKKKYVIENEHQILICDLHHILDGIIMPKMPYILKYFLR